MHNHVKGKTSLLTLAVAALVLAVAGWAAPQASANTLTGVRNVISSTAPSFHSSIDVHTLADLSTSMAGPNLHAKDTQLAATLALRATPEPSSYLLLGTALGALAFLMWKRRTAGESV